MKGHRYSDCSLDFRSPSVPNQCILSEKHKPFHMLLDIISSTLPPSGSIYLHYHAMLDTIRITFQILGNEPKQWIDGHVWKDFVKTKDKGGKRRGNCQQTKLQIHVKTFFHSRLSCLLYTSPSPRDRTRSRMPSSA